MRWLSSALLAALVAACASATPVSPTIAASPTVATKEPLPTDPFVRLKRYPSCIDALSRPPRCIAFVPDEAASGLHVGMTKNQFAVVCERLGGAPLFGSNPQRALCPMWDHASVVRVLFDKDAETLVSIDMIFGPDRTERFEAIVDYLCAALGQPLLQEDGLVLVWRAEQANVVVGGESVASTISFQKRHDPALDWPSCAPVKNDADVIECVDGCQRLAFHASTLCEHDACRWDPADCVVEKCDSKCAPARATDDVMWCDTRTFNWCRRDYCPRVDELRKGWCEGSKPEKALCLAQTRDDERLCEEACR